MRQCYTRGESVNVSADNAYTPMMIVSTMLLRILNIIPIAIFWGGDSHHMKLMHGSFNINFPYHKWHS
jgi:hypothetical protein